jgi:peptidyl-prolyl cis-trans isomerase C
MIHHVTRFFAGLSLLFVLGCATHDARPKEYLVSHILSPTQETANLALARLNAGATFEQVAREESADKGTKYNGGRIAHWTDANQWTVNFAAEVKRLKVGQVSAQPVRTEFGWHIVRVDAIR